MNIVHPKIVKCRGLNLLKGICNFSQWISSVVRPLKHMLHHLHHLKWDSLLHSGFHFHGSDLEYMVGFAIQIAVWYLFECSKQVLGNENPSTLICFASKSTNAGQITSKLHVIELGAQPGSLYVLFHLSCSLSSFMFSCTHTCKCAKIPFYVHASIEGNIYISYLHICWGCHGHDFHSFWTTSIQLPSAS